MVGHRDEVITNLKDETCTLWAFGWLAFQRRAVKAFSSLDFNFPIPDPDEEEVEESVSEDEANPEVSSDTPSSIPLPGEVEVPFGAGSPISPAGVRLLTCTSWRLTLLRLLVAPPRTFRPICIISALSSKPWTSVMPTLALLFYGYPSFFLLGFPVFFYDPC